MRLAFALIFAIGLAVAPASAQQPTDSDMGSGAAWFDHDRDGDIDLLLLTPLGAVRLFQNTDGVFEEITESHIPSGIEAVGDAALGISCGDLNNDGHPDVFLTMNGTNFLMLNDGTGVFELAGRRAGIKGEHMSASNVMFDYDNDGLLDIFVTNYVGHPNQLFHCTGIDESGTPHYEEVAEQLGMDYAKNGQSNWGLGAVVCDFDNDGDMDLYVGNDYNGPGDGFLNDGDNIYYRNNGDGTFTDATDEAGLREHGWAMGVAFGDFDGNGYQDIFVANFWEDALYANNGDGTFTDVTRARKVITGFPGEWHYNGWGTAFLDFDNDGDLDIHVANGFIPNDQGQIEDEPDQLWENLGGPAMYNFKEVTGPSNVGTNVGDARGATYGDFNRDGLVDILVVNNDYLGKASGNTELPPRVMFVNRGDGTFQDRAFSLGFRDKFVDGETAPGYKQLDGNRWVQIQPLGTESNRSAIGATVTVVAGGKTQVQQVGGQSYCSANSPYLHFGLGKVDVIDRIHVRFPAGNELTQTDVAVDQILTLIEPSTPVRLLSFGLSSVNAGVRLTWEWADDGDAAGFQIHRRHAGVENAIAFVPSGRRVMEWTDVDAPTGEVVYTLEAVYRDGSSQRLQSQAIRHGFTGSARLGAAFPNPVRGAASIPLRVPTAGSVTLEIVDVTGRVVRSLRETVAAGESMIRWDSHDDAGRRVAAGTYFYRLRGEAGGGKLVVRP